MFERTQQRLIDFTRSRYAVVALAFVSFWESIAFPIPTDVMLAPMALAMPKRAYVFAAIATLASVFGGIAGYVIGALFYNYIGVHIINLYGGQSAKAHFDTLYHQWGIWVVLIAAFTPVPYKIVTIISGIVGFPLHLFVITSVIGRGGRFFLVAWVIRCFGQMGINITKTIFARIYACGRSQTLLRSGAIGTGAMLLLTAMAFQYIGGLEPCMLCVWQRAAHSATIAFGMVAALLAWSRRNNSQTPIGHTLQIMCDAAAACAMLVGVGLAIYHTGVEYTWWHAPTACSASNTSALLSSNDLLNFDSPAAAPPIACNVVLWRFLGLSMAAWNAMVSTLLVGVWLRVLFLSFAQQTNVQDV